MINVVDVYFVGASLIVYQFRTWSFLSVPFNGKCKKRCLLFKGSPPVNSNAMVKVSFIRIIYSLPFIIMPLGTKIKIKLTKVAQRKRLVSHDMLCAIHWNSDFGLCYMLAFIYNRCYNIGKRQILLNYISPLDGCNMSVHIRNEIWFSPYKTFCMPRVALTVCGVSALLSVTTQPFAPVLGPPGQGGRPGISAVAQQLFWDTLCYSLLNRPSSTVTSVNHIT